MNIQQNQNNDVYNNYWEDIDINRRKEHKYERKCLSLFISIDNSEDILFIDYIENEKRKGRSEKEIGDELIICKNEERLKLSAKYHNSKRIKTKIFSKI